ncbi:MAG: DUF2807 domain-containing protein [Bacteroidales bacterium]|nr:DUF2807 domain-containing protein [Bacteroidales bacterium]
MRHKIEGNGHVISENRSLASFTQITSEGEYDVYFSPGQNYQVTIEAEGNLIPYVETGIHGHDLVIKTRNHRRLENHFPIKVFVEAPYVDDVILSGSGKVYIDSLSTSSLHLLLSGSGNMEGKIWTNTLNAKISGSGEINLQGIAHQSQMEISGSGDIYAFSLQQDTCFADISGSGSMKLWVLDFLDARITGSGKIYYQGNPAVSTHITGSGSIIHQ